ncbi:hypothetical protein, partial [Actinotalea sp. JY-7885]|uniref:hypothetical protein n=1 Tax=Actinotalea sp. JY-7885 TaxID=2758576 RepID=UPI001CB73F63
RRAAAGWVATRDAVPGGDAPGSDAARSGVPGVGHPNGVAGRGRRVRVFGTSGSGKTTFARALAERRGVPHLELDAIFHQPGWRPASEEEFHAAIRAFLAAAPAGWVVDGNYTARVGPLLDDADTVVWLDFPRHVVMARVIRRTLGRLLSRRELWNGNRESWRGLVAREPEENIVLWAWRSHADNAVRFQQMQAPHWVRLRSPRAARRWLATTHP